MDQAFGGGKNGPQNYYKTSYNWTVVHWAQLWVNHKRKQWMKMENVWEQSNKDFEINLIDGGNVFRSDTCSSDNTGTAHSFWQLSVRGGSGSIGDRASLASSRMSAPKSSISLSLVPWWIGLSVVFLPLRLSFCFVWIHQFPVCPSLL